MELGKIKTISKNDDDQLVCEIDFGAQLGETAVLFGSSNSNEWPLPGDEVLVDMDGNDNIIIAVFRATPSGIGQGEAILYSRDSSGNIKAKVTVNAAGHVVLNDGTEKAVRGDTFESQYTPHAHTGAFGPTSGVITPLTPAAFNTTVKL